MKNWGKRDSLGRCAKCGRPLLAGTKTARKKNRRATKPETSSEKKRKPHGAA